MLIFIIFSFVFAESEYKMNIVDAYKHPQDPRPISTIINQIKTIHKLEIKIDWNNIIWDYFWWDNPWKYNKKWKLNATIDENWNINWKIVWSRCRDFECKSSTTPRIPWICWRYPDAPSKTEIKVIWKYNKATKKINLTLYPCSKVAFVTFESIKLVDLTSCDEWEIVIDWECENIKELCSDDEKVNYNVSKKECFCPNWYKLTKDKTCEEVEEMIFKVSFPEDKPPFLMDWKQHKIKLFVKDWEWKPMKATKIAIKYTNAPKQWKVINIKELSIWEYLLTYQTAIVETWNPSGRMDWLYIFYKSPSQWKEVYKTYEIPLWTWTPIKIKREWFKETTNSIVFLNSTAKIYVFVKNSKWEKKPVYNATISIWWTNKTQITNKDWIAILNSPEEIKWKNESKTLEVMLEPTENILERQSKTLKQYEKLIKNKNLKSSQKISFFIKDFPVYIAQLNNDKIQSAIIWLKRVGYTMLYMNEWKNLIDDIASNVAWSLKNQISDTIDLIWTNEKLSKYIWESSNLKIQKILPDINERMDLLWCFFQQKAVNTIKLWLRKYAKNFKSERVNELFWIIFWKYWRDDLLEKWVNEIQNVSKDKIEKLLKEYLTKKFDEMINKKTEKLLNMIENEDFESSEFDNDIYNSKMNSLNLRNKYLKTHNTSYNITMIKNYSDLVNNTVLETMKITQIYKKYAEITEKWYKAVRSVFFNNAEIYYRISLYWDFMFDVENNINNWLWISYLQHKNNLCFKKNIFPKVYAEKKISNEDLTKINKYRWSLSLVWIQEKLLNINILFLKVFPENEDLLNIKEEIEMNKNNEKFMR